MAGEWGFADDGRSCTIAALVVRQRQRQRQRGIAAEKERLGGIDVPGAVVETVDAVQWME
jgi:hypothetical protein